MGQMALEMSDVIGQLGIETVNSRWIMCHLEPNIFYTLLPFGAET